MRFLGPASRLVFSSLGARSISHHVGPVSLRAYRLGADGGQPWVLLHGLAASALSWLPALRDLRRDCSLLVPELAAAGGTRAPFGGLNVSEGTAAVADLIGRHCDGPVVLAGSSLGGWIATRVALAHPDRVRALLLVACGGYRNQDWGRVRDLVRVKNRDDVNALLAALFSSTRLPLHWGRPFFRSAYRSSWVRHILETVTVDDAFSEQDLVRLRLPVGLVWGSRDGIFTLEVARAMEAALPRCRLEVLPGCAHVVPWDCPRRFVAALRGFRTWLESNEPAA